MKMKSLAGFGELTFVAWLLFVSMGAAAKETQPTKKQTDDSASEAVPQVLPIPKLDLGVLEIKNLEPTRNQTAKVTFAIHLAFTPGTDPAVVAELEHWQHRLREQVIVAVRSSELTDFTDPELLRLRKHLLYRINRVLKPIQVEAVLLADFTYSSE